MRFQYNLDGTVLVQSGANLYIDAVANFELDSGASLLAPLGFYFAPGKINKISNGQDDVPGVANVAPYNAHLSNVVVLLAAKAAREAAASAAALAAYAATPGGIAAAARSAEITAVKADPIIAAMLALSPTAQAAAIEAMTTLPQLKAEIKRLAMIVNVLAKRL